MKFIKSPNILIYSKKNTSHYESNSLEINNNFLFNVGSSVEKACDYLEEQI